MSNNLLCNISFQTFQSFFGYIYQLNGFQHLWRALVRCGFVRMFQVHNASVKWQCVPAFQVSQLRKVCNRQSNEWSFNLYNPDLQCMSKFFSITSFRWLRLSPSLLDLLQLLSSQPCHFDKQRNKPDYMVCTLFQGHSLCESSLRNNRTGNNCKFHVQSLGSPSLQYSSQTKVQQYSIKIRWRITLDRSHSVQHSHSPFLFSKWIPITPTQYCGSRINQQLLLTFCIFLAHHDTLRGKPGNHTLLEHFEIPTRLLCRGWIVTRHAIKLMLPSAQLIIFGTWFSLGRRQHSSFLVSHE